MFSQIISHIWLHLVHQVPISMKSFVILANEIVYFTVVKLLWHKQGQALISRVKLQCNELVLESATVIRSRKNAAT